MLPDIGGESGAKLAMALAAVAIALMLFYMLLRAWRRRGSHSFLRGGKSRPRLAVLDATAVDPRRRLVLVRRDDVEHLILIGGPSDVVVESGIGALPAQDAKSELPSAETASLAKEAPFLAGATPAATRPVAAASSEPAGERDPHPSASIEPNPADLPKAPPPDVRAERHEPEPRPSAGDDRPEEEPEPTSDIAGILESQRQRVFGRADPVEHAPQGEPSPYERAYLDEEDEAPPKPAAERGTPSSAVLRFDDFLDTEVAGELSGIDRGRNAPERPKPREAPAPETDARSATLDEEMSRLLQQLSHKR